MKSSTSRRRIFGADQELLLSPYTRLERNETMIEHVRTTNLWR